MEWGNGEQPSKRARWALVLAIALHAAVVLALLVTPHRRTTPQAAPPVEAPEAQIEVVTEPVTPDLDKDDRVAPSVAERERPQSHVASATALAPKVEPAPPAPEPEGTAAPVAPIAMTRAAPAPAIGLALGAPNAFATTGAREEPTGGRPGWANAAELARAALRGKKLRMPTTATGAELRIEIVSEWKLPSGHDPGTNVSVLGVPVAKGEGKKSTTVDILDPIPKIEMVELAPGLKVPVPQVNVTIIAVHGDPADLGARPRRVVHTKLIESKVL